MKKNSANETEYLYSCARIRAMERRLPDKALLERIILADGRETASLLKDRGIDLSLGIEGAIAKLMSATHRELLSELPDAAPAKIFLYQYDCNNLKLAIKAAIMGQSAEKMLFSCGTLAPSVALDAVRSGDFSPFPENMAKEAGEAARAAAATGNPQTVDLLLDRACFLDMLEAARPYPRALSWVKLKIDALNALFCIRIIRLGGDSALLEELLLPGGDIDRSIFLDARAGGESALFEHLGRTRLSALSRVSGKGGRASLSELERAADDLFIEAVREARFIPFGAEIITAYTVALEYALKNVRIILAGKEAGLDADAIRGRIRTLYV